MKIKDVIRLLEEFAPASLQETYDNSGLIVGNKENNVKGVLCTIDTTEEIIEEAEKLDANLIVSHHPIIFNGIKSLTGKNSIERTIVLAIKKDIAIYAGHTNFDNILQGVNRAICDKLGLKNCKILSPKKNYLFKIVTFVPEKKAQKVREALFGAGAGNIGNYDSCSYNVLGDGTFRGNESSNPYAGEKEKLHFEKEVRIESIVTKSDLTSVVKEMIKAHPYEEVAYDIYPLENEFQIAGSGMIGRLYKPVSSKTLLGLLKESFGTPVIKYAGNSEKEIQVIAVCGGAGSFLIDRAINENADAFITGDIKYHQFFEAENKLLLCDIGHYESEQFTSNIFYNLLTKKSSKFAVHLSRVVTNPIKYHI
ncbi:MAG: Nif3-like dinuclear metal center hexameric protein [Bacteroidales bacterium]|nr:Nif3-like dinuclear metal center hexameric protein [Bacteroidales bacterium]